MSERKGPLFNPESPQAVKRYKAAARLDELDAPYAPYRYGVPGLPVAINAALTTRRPLLLRGEAGSGKSSLAYDVALALGWSYYERVISSRMNANDLLWQFDAIQRLSDASNAQTPVGPIEDYVRPQTLWWALAPDSAGGVKCSIDPVRVKGADIGAVVLLDEIDKADPDLPNDLLVPLGDGRFRVPELGAAGDIRRTRESVLIVITSNGERELPAPFLRRCVCFQLETPGPDELARIARIHMPELKNDRRLEKWVERMLQIRAVCKNDQHRPGTAEILDAVRACLELGIDVDHEHWKALTLAMGWKNSERPPEAIR